MVKKISDSMPSFEYFVKGENPTLLIHSGTHGDEYETIDIIKNCIEKYEDKLPDFVFVPRVSPSAVSAKTRFTSNGKDINRIFFSDSTDPEVAENIKAVEGYKFDLMVSFHEDPGNAEYYIYDSGFSIHESIHVKAHNKKLKSLGIKLLTGIDDPEDQDLNYEFVEGYRKFTEKPGLKNNGMTTVWAMSEGHVRESLTPEIPGRLSLKEKELIVETFFTDVLLA